MTDKRKMRIKSKLLVFTHLTITIIFLLIFTVYYSLIHLEYKHRYESNLIATLKTISGIITYDNISLLKTKSNEQQRILDEMEHHLKNFIKQNDSIKDIYILGVNDKQDNFVYLLDLNPNQTKIHSGSVFNPNNNPEVKKAVNKLTIDLQIEKQHKYNIISGYAPIRDKSGKTVAVAGLDMQVYTVTKEERNLIITTIIIFILAMALTTFFLWKMINRFTKPIYQIVKGIDQIRKGNLNYKLSLNTNDEFEDISSMLNKTTEVLAREREILEKDLERSQEQKRKIFQVYRDVIYSVTQGKFNLLTYKESLPIENEGQLITLIKLDRPENINQARTAVEELLKAKKYPQKDLMHVLLCVSEAATNAVKHGKDATVKIKLLDNKLRVITTDYGTGMQFDKLPNMVFLDGFSTKISMGYGYSLMFKFADKIYLSTSKYGTFLALEFSI